MEISQRQIPQDLTHVALKKQTLRCSELVVARGEVGGSRGARGDGRSEHAREELLSHGVVCPKPHATARGLSCTHTQMAPGPDRCLEKFSQNCYGRCSQYSTLYTHRAAGLALSPVCRWGNGWRSRQTGTGESSLLPRAGGGSRKSAHLG